MSEDYTKGLDPELSASLERLRVAMESREQGELFANAGSKDDITTPPLLPDRRAQLDFFVCDILDAVPKDDIGSMEHPMFTLSTRPDRAIRYYEHNGNSVTITPSVLGLATIFDKDVLIYCISQLISAWNKGEEISRTVRVTAYDLLKTTNRPTAGVGYERLVAAIKRLEGTRIETNIATGGKRIREGFGVIDSWRIIERSPTEHRMVAMEITLSEWLYNAVVANEVLTIHPDYFRLRKPIERRLYELARKHAGYQGKWQVSLLLLKKKCDSRGNLRKFRAAIRQLVKHQHLPDYQIDYHERDDKVRFYSRLPHGAQAQINDIIKDNQDQKKPAVKHNRHVRSRTPKSTPPSISLDVRSGTLED